MDLGLLYAQKWERELKRREDNGAARRRVNRRTPKTGEPVPRTIRSKSKEPCPERPLRHRSCGCP